MVFESTYTNATDNENSKPNSLFCRQTTIQAAEEYRERGLVPIPVAPTSKIPLRPQWQKSRLETPLNDFIEGGNVAILLGSASGDLVDIDLDCEEAMAAADLLLPATSAKFGRASKRDKPLAVQSC